MLGQSLDTIVLTHSTRSMSGNISQVGSRSVKKLPLKSSVGTIDLEWCSVIFSCKMDSMAT